MIQDLRVATQNANGKTSAVITFGNDPFVIERRVGGNSLVDGAYQLTVVARQVVTSAGGIVMAADEQFGESDSDAFFRYFGDSDGDWDVDGQDYGRFSSTFMRRSPDQAYRSDLDFDGDGDVDGSDLAHFRNRFSRRMQR